jgi:TetR/AcrR family transcriptional regulator, ethionamide resistance regulator
VKVNLAARAAAAQSRRTRTREALLRAAMTVIAEKGPDAASVEDFVAAAGVARGTFYNYFPTVADLIAALNDHLAEEISRALTPFDPETTDAAHYLALVMHRIFASLATDPVRGWVGLRMDVSALRRPLVLEAKFDKVFVAGVARGRFRDFSLGAARNLMFGTGRMAQYEILLGRCGPHHAEEVAAVILTGLGVPADEAADLSRRARATAARLT